MKNDFDQTGEDCNKESTLTPRQKEEFKDELRVYLAQQKNIAKMQEVLREEGIDATDDEVFYALVEIEAEELFSRLSESGDIQKLKDMGANREQVLMAMTMTARDIVQRREDLCALAEEKQQAVQEVENLLSNGLS